MKMNIADQVNIEDLKNIEHWLEGLSKDSFSKVSAVSEALNSISELTNTTIFNVPYEALEKTGLDSISIKAILTELWRKGTIDLLEYSGGSSVASWNKDFEPDNSFNDCTMVELKPMGYKYLRQSLTKGKTKIISFPEGRDYEYENGELRIRLRDGSACTLDLSKAVVLRPIFESIFFLYKEGNEKLFSREQLLIKYGQLTRGEIGWREYIKRKSSLGKMINSKEYLKNRIVWEFDKTSGKYKFEILGLSDN
jgi:hypothetical protein